MVSVDVELALVGLVAMLEPATLISSVLALVLGDRPLHTGMLCYLGGIGLTVAIGVAAPLVLGNVAAAPRGAPRRGSSCSISSPALQFSSTPL